MLMIVEIVHAEWKEEAGWDGEAQDEADDVLDGTVSDFTFCHGKALAYTAVDVSQADS